jgi:hypothetical protein
MISLALTPSGICNPLKKCNLELEARVGIGQVRRFSPLLFIHSEHLRHQRHAASYASNAPIVKHFRRLVKPRQYALTTHPVLSNYLAKTRSLALSLALKFAFM